MKTTHLNLMIIGISALLLPFYANTKQCAFEIPSNHELTLNGYEGFSRTLSCEIIPRKEKKKYFLNIVSMNKTSIVNDLRMPEGTMVSFIFSAIDDNHLTLTLEANARLDIMNDSLDNVFLQCVQLS